MGLDQVDPNSRHHVRNRRLRGRKMNPREAILLPLSRAMKAVTHSEHHHLHQLDHRLRQTVIPTTAASIVAIDASRDGGIPRTADAPRC